MATWLYAAGTSKANVQTTYDLASRAGIVWRSYFANVGHPQRIAHVKSLQPGDTLILGYRESGNIELLGTMTIAAAKRSVECSPVFTEFPERYRELCEQNGYGADPVLKKLIGIAVTDVKATSGVVKSLSRNSLIEMKSPPQQKKQRSILGRLFR